MLWPLPRAFKALILTCYAAALYFALVWLTTPAPLRTFLREESKIRSRYVLVYLWTEEPMPALLRAVRKCGFCYMTSERDFIPMSEYDAVVVAPARSGAKDNFEKAINVYPDKTFVLNASAAECVGAKFNDCQAWAARVDSQRSYGICEFCEHVRSERTLEPFIII